MVSGPKFHLGELAVQQRAGVVEQAARLSAMVEAPRLEGAAAKFLEQRRFAVLTARDGEGRLWTSPLTGRTGFLRVEGTTVVVSATPEAHTPLSPLRAGSAAALIAIEFGIRRRLRVNGTVVAVDTEGFRLEADQAFGNCPSYIQQRALDLAAEPGQINAGLSAGGTTLTQRQLSAVCAADTFFLGTAHPVGGLDTSHKGGRPGFVRVEADGSFWWPDYAGNNLFNSLGNLTENPEAAALFIDFESGTALHVSGVAELTWVAPGSAGDDGATGRRVRFYPHRVVESSLSFRGTTPVPSPDNPILSSDGVV